MVQNCNPADDAAKLQKLLLAKDYAGAKALCDLMDRRIGQYNRLSQLHLLIAHSRALIAANQDDRDSAIKYFTESCVLSPFFEDYETRRNEEQILALFSGMDGDWKRSQYFMKVSAQWDIEAGNFSDAAMKYLSITDLYAMSNQPTEAKDAFDKAEALIGHRGNEDYRTKRQKMISAFPHILTDSQTREEAKPTSDYPAFPSPAADRGLSGTSVERPQCPPLPHDK